MANNNPIGVFDSGMGGLSVWRVLRRALPHEELLFLGDGKNCPYGDKSPEEVQRYAHEVTEALLARGCKMIVVACNTATAMAISQLRHDYPQLPFVGLEPAVKPACLTTQSGVVAVAATTRSFEGELFLHTAAQYEAQVRILKVVGKGWVELVENDLEKSDEAFAAVESALLPALEEGADRIVLGCTHYPFLREQIARVAAPFGAQIIDSAAAVERRVEYLLDTHSLRAASDHVAKYEFMSFADEAYCNRLRRKALMED